jgi:hypothetical protein
MKQITGKSKMPFETKVDKKMRQKNGQKRQSAILLINLSSPHL